MSAVTGRGDITAQGANGPMPAAEVRAEVQDLLARHALGYDEGDLKLIAECRVGGADPARGPSTTCRTSGG